LTSPLVSAHAEHGHGPNRFTVPALAARLDADTSLAGRGVTIAFLDSGFFGHPDLTASENRILAFHDVAAPGSRLSVDGAPEGLAWHGTQTSVVAAGDGHLSDGLYRALAWRARVVLVKVGSRGRITEEDIARGLEWVLANRERYGIRIASLSVGGDEDTRLPESRVNRLAEEAVREGLVLVVAAGNSGCMEKHRSLAPATAPSVITVGGYGEESDRTGLALYCSSYGFTADGVVKPEIITLASGVAAPILPGTPTFLRAQALSRLAAVPDQELPGLVAGLRSEGVELPAFDGVAPEALRYWAEETMRQEKIVATHYQHVDGTSFAAPIVASVVAQMLEANPSLTPAAVKNLLIAAAERIGAGPALRQGHGVLNARRAAEAARAERHVSDATAFAPPRLENGRVLFTYHDDRAQSVSVLGDFNGWDARHAALTREAGGVWRARIAAPPPGQYRYKFLVDGSRWVEDASNGSKKLDPFDGFDSVLILAG
jgi:serine protease AprX